MAAIVYFVFKPKNKPERTSGPDGSYEQQQPAPRKKGLLETLMEDMLGEAQGLPPQHQQPQRKPAQARPDKKQAASGQAAKKSLLETRKTLFEQKQREEKKKAAKMNAGLGSRDSRLGGQQKKGASSPQFDTEPLLCVHKNVSDGKGISMERTSIVEGFIWSQVLGDPVCRRSARSHRR
jgi:hypothetical protein